MKMRTEAAIKKAHALLRVDSGSATQRLRLSMARWRGKEGARARRTMEDLWRTFPASWGRDLSKRRQRQCYQAMLGAYLEAQGTTKRSVRRPAYLEMYE
jgi:hypothetical protein